MKIPQRYSAVGLLLLILILCQALGAAPPTAILGAFSEETAWLDSQLVGRRTERILGMKFITGELVGQPVVMALTGVGKVNAALTTALLLQHFHPRAVLFTGVAGSLDPDLSPGDVVIGSGTLQHDLADFYADSIVNFGVRNPATGIRNPVIFPADSTLLAAAQKAAPTAELEDTEISGGARPPQVVTGRIATGDLFISSTPKKQELHLRLGASAVDMEGAAVAQVCHQADVPCLIVRALSDRSDENAEQDFEKYYRAAARNANRVVLATLRELAAGAVVRWRNFHNPKTGISFSYPDTCIFDAGIAPDSTFIYAFLKDDQGRFWVSMDLSDLDSYPRGTFGSDSIPFMDAALQIAQWRCMADGADGSVYSCGVARQEPFRNSQRLGGIKIFLNIENVDYYNEDTLRSVRGPMYAFDWRPAGRRYVFFIEAAQEGGESVEALEREIINTVRMN